MIKKLWDALVCIVFVTMCLSLAVWFLVSYSPRASSVLENRTLAQFETPSFSQILSGKFQTGFEKAVSDQAFFRDRAILLNAQKQRLVAALPNLLVLEEPEKGEILQVLDECALYSLDGELYLLQLPVLYSETVDAKIAEAAQAIGELSARLPDTNIVVFDIEPVFISAANPLNSLYPDAAAGRFADTMRDNLPDSVTYLVKRYDNIEGILREFYRTDHHFNAYCAASVYTMLYNALCERIALAERAPMGDALDVSNIFEVPNSEMMGSKARGALYDGISEPLTDIDAVLPEFDIYLNGEPFTRSHRENVINGAVRANAEAGSGDARYAPMYAEYFGYDHAEILYENKGVSNGRTLLLIGPSYTQTFERLLASHYEKTYVCDPRYFGEELGTTFDVSAYAEEIGADDIVYFVQSRYFAEEVWQVR